MEENLGVLHSPLDDICFSVRRRGRSSRSSRKGAVRTGRKRWVIIKECVVCDEMLERSLNCRKSRVE